MEQRKGFRTLVFLASFSCLMFELIVSRLADFHLDSRNSFIAIPITFLGLAMGSLHVHFRKRLVERFSVRTNLVFLAVVCIGTLTLTFLLFTRYLTVIGAYTIMANLRYAFIKSAVFVCGFIVPFYYFGRVLTVCYHLNRDRIGAIYSADFFGASLACFLTPVLFHELNLPGVLVVFTATLSLLILLFLRLSWKPTVALLVVLAGLNVAFLNFILYTDNHTNFESLSGTQRDRKIEEVAHAWNEFSRVSVIRSSAGTGKPSYKIIHDNAQSNVNIAAYVPDRFPKVNGRSVVGAVFLLGRPIQDVMVMFAGCGAQMIPFHEYSGGKAMITGIELNPLVKELAVTTPELASYRLQEFFDLPNVDLRIQEGRSFMISDERKFDVVFVGSKAQTTEQLTGHSRKYLDTVEAYGLYLDHLKPDGVLFFYFQPFGDVITTLKRVFQERGLPPFEQCAMALRLFGKDALMVSPSGFTPEEIRTFCALDSPRAPVVYYAPNRKGNRGWFAGAIPQRIDPAVMPITDDRPFVWDLSLKDYTIFPEASKLHNSYYFFNWSRITTLLGLTLFVALFIATVYLRRRGRPPVATLVYLLITGFCYLLIEVTFMAKFELFLQDLFVSMATTLTVFLLTSGLGSLLSRRVGPRLDMRPFPFIVAGVVAASLFLLNHATGHLLALPLLVRIAIVCVLTLPVGLCLGMFYPFAVAGLVKRGYEESVPITYGISTLASVIGATYAMTMMLEFGFNALLRQAIIGYVLLGVLVIVYSLMTRRNVLSLRD